MTRSAATDGKGAAPAAPTTVHADAAAALARFAGEQRVIGAMRAHEAFDGILRELVASLVEARDMMITALGAAGRWEGVQDALDRLDQEIQYVRKLASIGEDS